MPTIILNPIAIVAAVFVGFMFCYLWNGVIFDKAIRRELNVPDDEVPQGGALAKALIMTLVGIGVMTFVLANDIAAWSPSSWGIETDAEMPMLAQALQAAFFSWLGYMFPVLLDGVVWEKRSWKLFAIKGGYYFLLLLITAIILLLL